MDGMVVIAGLFVIFGSPIGFVERPRRSPLNLK